MLVDINAICEAMQMTTEKKPAYRIVNGQEMSKQQYQEDTSVLAAILATYHRGFIDTQTSLPTDKRYDFENPEKTRDYMLIYGFITNIFLPFFAINDDLLKLINTTRRATLLARNNPEFDVGKAIAEGAEGLFKDMFSMWKKLFDALGRDNLYAVNNPVDYWHRIGLRILRAREKNKTILTPTSDRDTRKILKIARQELNRHKPSAGDFMAVGLHAENEIVNVQLGSLGQLNLFEELGHSGSIQAEQAGIQNMGIYLPTVPEQKAYRAIQKIMTDRGYHHLDADPETFKRIEFTWAEYREAYGGLHYRDKTGKRRTKRTEEKQALEGLVKLGFSRFAISYRYDPKPDKKTGKPTYSFKRAVLSVFDFSWEGSGLTQEETERLAADPAAIPDSIDRFTVMPGELLLRDVPKFHFLKDIRIYDRFREALGSKRLTVSARAFLDHIQNKIEKERRAARKEKKLFKSRYKIHAKLLAEKCLMETYLKRSQHKKAAEYITKYLAAAQKIGLLEYAMKEEESYVMGLREDFIYKDSDSLAAEIIAVETVKKPSKKGQK